MEKRKVILFIAMSLDGKVADNQGAVDWLKGSGEENGSDMESAVNLLETIDTVILGYNTYHQIVTELAVDQWPYEGMKSYVLTHRQIENQGEIAFIDESVGDLIGRLKQKTGKDIWICGGASIVNQAIRLNLIDAYHISVIPTILGEGINLFQGGHPEQLLQLVSTKSYNGITDLVYERR